MKTIAPLLLVLIFFNSFLNPLQSQERLKDNIPHINHYKYSDIKGWSPTDDELCEPVYQTGCGMGDGFTDFAVEEIENYNSGCEDLNGTGWSQYLEMGPAILYPGITHDFIMQTGYDNQNVTIWIDFNDDFELTSDEIILFDYELVDAGEFYTASVTIPTDASLGLHFLRARTNWQGSSDDACEEYNYGEAEDYFVLIGSAETGSLEGWVTELDGGTPVEGALISLEGLVSFNATTTANGYYFIDYIFVGEYDLTCTKTGYNNQNTEVLIQDGILLNQDFELTAPEIVVNPQSINVNLIQNGSTQEIVAIENNGDGPLTWSASLQIESDKKKALFDLQFQYPVAEAGGEAGIETDGNYIYTTKWNTGAILRYDLEGNYLATLSINVAARDLAYNGTYFYGSAALTTLYEMDFDNEVIVSTVTVPTIVRAIAYNDNEDVFYANNYSSAVVKFDLSGANLGEFDVGPVGENYYGFAYDNASLGGPYLWGYAQSGESNNEIVQIQLPSGTETGFTLDVKDKLSGPVFNMAGGLYTHSNMVFAKWTLGGLVQNEWLWGLELADAQTWISVDPISGTLNPGESEEIEIAIDAADLEPGEYIANVLFTTYPEVGTPEIEVTLNVSASAFLPCELTADVLCTDVVLSWEVCPSGSPDADSFYVYKDDIFLSTVLEMEFIDAMIYPEENHAYKVSAFYNGMETLPTTVVEVSVPTPENLEPGNLEAEISGGLITLTWDAPEGCLVPMSYNIYQDGGLLGTTSEETYEAGWGNYEFFVTAVYYFGESIASNSIVITDIKEYSDANISVYPNPTNDFLWIDTDLDISFLELLDGNGKSYFASRSIAFPLKLDVASLPPGVYILKTSFKGEVQLKKVVIQ